MSKCTAAQAIAAMEYWLGYYEKATAKYAGYRDKKYFELDKGANNYTYAGFVCGINGPAAAWCAMQVTLAIYEACGNDKAAAKEVMYGVWPYANCAQLWDAARTANRRGTRMNWEPQPGDVIIFTDDGTTRSHTGMVYAVDDTYVYTIEGNSSNMCRKRSYLRNSAYIYGYVRPDYADGVAPPVTPEQYGEALTVTLHELSKGCAGPEVKTLQRILYARGMTDDSGAKVAVDGDFGKSTKAAVVKLQKELGLDADGVVGAKTWAAMLAGLW